MKNFIYVLLFVIVNSDIVSQSKKNKIENGNDVITAMYNKYEGGKKWYKNFTFSQETHFITNGKEEKMEIWHEAATFPGKLIIKFNTKDSKKGVLFSNKRVFAFSEGKEPESKPLVHEVLIGAFDVYFLNPTETSRIFDSLGYNLKIVREDVFAGRRVYVVA